VAPQARDCTNRRYRYQDRIDERERAKNKTKSRVGQGRALVAVIKLKFGFTKVRYRGLDKNAHRLFRDLRPGEPVHGAPALVAAGGA